MSTSYISAFGILVKGRNARQPTRRCHSMGLGSFQLDGHAFTVCGCGNVFHNCDSTLKCKARVILKLGKRPKP